MATMDTRKIPHSSPRSLALACTTLLIPPTSFVALHVMHPAGRPEQLTDPQLIEWAESGAHQLWAGGVISLIVALTLFRYADLVVDRLRRWDAPGALTTWAGACLRGAATVLAVSAMLQITTGVVATPSEQMASATFLPMTALLYAELYLAAWALMAPAALATSVASAAPRWLRGTSLLLGLALVATLALPFVSWFPAFIWMLALGIAELSTRRA